MKSFFRKVKSNIVPIGEIILVIFMFFLPSMFNFSDSIGDKIELKISKDWMDYLFYLAFTNGDKMIGLLLAIVTLFAIRKKNKDDMFNKGDEYKDFSYCWYWICAKVLGYSKCSLVLVPINMQFKLVIHDTFKEFYTGEVEEKKDEQIEVKRDKNIGDSDEINFIIADTYPLDRDQLPQSKKALPTIKIERDNSIDHNRYNSPELVSKVVNEVRNLSLNNKKINIYATTNPKNTMNIAKKAFGLGDRSDLDLVTVFQQSNAGTRKFKEKGMVVYKRQ